MVNFTEPQKQCVTFSSAKNLVIEAGAGAGKTAVLAHRVAWKIKHAPPSECVAPHEIYMATFTRAAEKELRHRVLGLLSSYSDSVSDSTSNSQGMHTSLSVAGNLVHISTIDSLLMSLFETRYSAFWEDVFIAKESSLQRKMRTSAPQPQLIDDHAVRAEMNENLCTFFDELNVNRKTESLILDFILAGAIKDHGIPGSGRTPRDELLSFLTSEACILLNEEIPAVIQSTVHPAVPHLFKAICHFGRGCFVQRLAQGRITHTDRLAFLFNSFCLTAEQKKGTLFASVDGATPLRLKELIVDEYQDTNPAQHKLLATLATLSNARMIVVGDPKQSLYGFRRAKVEVFHELKNSSNWHHIELAENFRSHPDLLCELNTLSSHALNYKDPKIPLEFWNSPHGRAALLSCVPPLDLKPGRLATQDSRSSSDTVPWKRVNVITHSLNPDRINETPEIMKNKSDAAPLHFRHLSEELLVHTIQQVLGHHTTPCPSEIVVLCETNNDCISVQNILQLAKIPTNLAVKKAPHRAGLLHPQRTAIGLLTVLRGQGGLLPFDCTSLLLFDLFTSPLFGLNLIDAAETAHLALHFSATPQTGSTLRQSLARQLKLEKQSQLMICEFFETLEKLQILARSNLLAAWQIARSQLAHQSASSDALLFSQAMGPFAIEFSKTFENSLWRTQLQTPLAPNNASDTNNANVTSNKGETLCSMASNWHNHSLTTHKLLPRSLAEPIVTDTEEKKVDSHGAISVMTVHGAKGLQWPIVLFVPKTKDTQSQATFRCLQFSDRNVVQWLESSENPLEIYARLPLSSETEVHGGLLDLQIRSPENSKVESLPLLNELKLQERAEKMFERSRIFYTAITRAQEYLFLFSGLGASNYKNSLRDKIAELGVEDGPEKRDKKLEGFIPSTLGCYLDEAFELRSAANKGRGKRKIEREPWLTHEEAQLKGIDSQSPRSVSFIDKCAPSLETRVNHALELRNRLKLRGHSNANAAEASTNKNNPSPNLSSSLNTLSRSEVPSMKENFQPHVDWQITWPIVALNKVTDDADSRSEKKYSTLNQSDRASVHEQTEVHENSRLENSRLENIQKGILYHAEQEFNSIQSKESSNQNILDSLESISILFLREFEIWIEETSTIKKESDREALQFGASIKAPKRNIVDLLLFCKMSELLQLVNEFQNTESDENSRVLFGAPLFNVSQKGDIGNDLLSLRDLHQIDARNDSIVCLIVDYKTGQPSDSHHDQLRRYLDAMTQLIQTQIFDHLNQDHMHDQKFSQSSLSQKNSHPAPHFFVSSFLAYVQHRNMGAQKIKLVAYQQS